MIRSIHSENNFNTIIKNIVKADEMFRIMVM